MAGEFEALLRNALLGRDRGDPFPAAVLADWLDEHGDPDAASLARSGWPYLAGVVHREDARVRALWMALDDAEKDRMDRHHAGMLSADYEAHKVIRGVPCRIYSDRFSSDESVGIGYGPEEVWALTEDGLPFELTEEDEQIIRDIASIDHEPPHFDDDVI